MLVTQNELQNMALKVIIGGSITDTEALLKFRQDHLRLLRYDQQITDAARAGLSWFGKMMAIGMVMLLIFAVALSNIGDGLKSFLSGR